MKIGGFFLQFMKFYIQLCMLDMTAMPLENTGCNHYLEQKGILWQNFMYLSMQEIQNSFHQLHTNLIFVPFFISQLKVTIYSNDSIYLFHFSSPL